METSITGSVRPSAFAAGSPTTASAASSMMPSCSSPSRSSRIEHNMPRDSTPRMVPIFNSAPVAGMIVPGLANTAFMPACAFGAPQTTCTGSPAPVSTMHSRNLSAFGCFSAETTYATVKSFSRAPASSTDSTSRPMLVSLSAMVCASASVSSGAFSQESVNFIGSTLHPESEDRRPRIHNGAASADRIRRTGEYPECHI